nr:MAG: replication polyprotein [Crogonang virus 101]
MASQAYSWCFTHNNYTDEDINFWQNINCRFIIYGKEIAPTTGTPHLQGFIMFSTNKRFNTLKKLFPKDVNFRACNGSPQQNITYVSKNGELYERGERPKQGRRTDLDEVRNAALDGGMRYVSSHFNYQQIRVAREFLTYNENQRESKPLVEWFWGPSGTGKTRTAIELMPEDRWTSGKSLKWWDGYDAHKNVLIDDFRGDFCTFHELLRILDRYEYRVECKGGSRQLLANHIIITSPYKPCQAYPNLTEHLSQLLRRIDIVREFGQEALPTDKKNGKEVGGNTNPDNKTLDDLM